MLGYLGTSIVKLTRQLVKELSGLPVFKGDRPFMKKRQAFLAERYASGLFYAPRFAVATMDGKRYRMNGRHSTSMLSEVSGGLPGNLMAVIDEWKCDEPADLAVCFAQYDDRRSNRTPPEITNAHARVHSELDHISRTILCVIVNGLTYGLEDGKGMTAITADNRAALLHQHQDFVLWAAPLVGSRTMSRVGVVGAMFRTYASDINDATLFWRWAANEDHPDRKHPSRVLARFLIETARPGVHGRKVITARMYYVKCVHAWNAFRGGNGTALCYHRNAPIPPIR